MEKNGRKMRVILDTSVFHNFDHSSQILYDLKQKGIIQVYITPMLLEESFGLMLYNNASDDAKKRMEFILNISSDRYFEDIFEIIKSELAIFPRCKDYHFMKIKTEQDLKDNMRMFIAGGRFKDDHTHKKVEAEVRSNKIKANNLRMIGLDMRKEIAQKVKALGIKHKDIKETWEDYKKSGLNKWGVSLILKKGFLNKASRLLGVLVWIINKNKCSYFHDWVQGILYAKFYDTKYPDLKIDKNAQSDIQHLVFLREVDAIISDDKRFMRKAWEDIYASSGKKYFSVSEIAKLG